MIIVPFSLLGTVVLIALIIGAVAYIGIGIVALALFTLVLYQPFRLLKFVPRRQMRFWLSIAMAVVFWLVLAANIGEGGIKSYVGAAGIAGITLVLYWLIGLDPSPAEEAAHADESTGVGESEGEGERTDGDTPLIATSTKDDSRNRAESEAGRGSAPVGTVSGPGPESHPESTAAAPSDHEAGPAESTASLLETKPAASEVEAHRVAPTTLEPEDPSKIDDPSPRSKALDEAEAVRRAIFEATQDDGR